MTGIKNEQRSQKSGPCFAAILLHYPKQIPFVDSQEDLNPTLINWLLPLPPDTASGCVL